MGSVEGIRDLHMSGARAVFEVEDGARVREADVAAAFEAVGMKLESFERAPRPRPAAVFLVDSGVT